MCLLKQFHTKSQVPVLPEIIDGHEEYVVASITSLLKHHELKSGKGRGKKLCRQYLVEWEGYGQDFNSWEPQANLSDGAAALDAIQDYWNSVQGIENRILIEPRPGSGYESSGPG